MFQVTVVCSACEEENEAIVETVDAVDREVCPCGHNYVVLSVATFHPLHARQAEIHRLPRRPKLPKAA